MDWPTNRPQGSLIEEWYLELLTQECHRFLDEIGSYEHTTSPQDAVPVENEAAPTTQSQNESRRSP